MEQIIKLYYIKDLKSMIKSTEKPNSVEFILAHYLHIRVHQISYINQLIKAKKIKARPVGNSKIRYYITFIYPCAS